MILLVHMLFGAAIGSAVKNPYLAVFLALLGHYFLDLFPHIEYDIPHFRSKNWQKSFPDFMKIFLDFCLGVIIVSLFSSRAPIIYLCGFVALIPDGLTFVTKVFEPKILALHHKIHTQNVHFLKYKKFPVVLRIFSQIFFFLLSLTLLAH